MMHRASTRWTFWHVMALLGGLIVLIGISTFLAMMLLKYFQTPEQLWAAITHVFTLFGVLLAVGVAFALLAVALSYLSLNDKLQQAQSYLAQARLHLNEYQQFTSKENQIQQQVYELIKNYDNLAENPHISEINHIQSLIKTILSSEFADFEARLVARAVQQDWQAKQALQAAKTQHNENAWQIAIQYTQQAAALWQTLLAASPDFLRLGQQKHFFSAQLNHALALQNSAALNGQTKQPEYYRQLNALYRPILFAEKSTDNQFNQIVNEAAYQDGLHTYQAGELLWQQGSQNLSEVRQKWQYAQQSFQKALEINANDAQTAEKWGYLLEREARLVAQSDANKLPEARQLWLAAREKYRIALDVDDKRAEAALNWGNTLSDEATALVQTDATQFGEARILWQSAREKFKQAIDINQKFDFAAHQAGMTFNKEADAVLHINQHTEEARTLWKSAGEHFQAALDINPSRFETANAWGLVLAKEADLLMQLDNQYAPEAKHLWQLAQQRFHRALEIEPNLQAASANWRTILSHEINILNNDEQRELLQTTREKVVSLQHLSPAHAQSVVIADLARFVEQHLHNLQPEITLQPPAFSPITRSDSA